MRSSKIHHQVDESGVGCCSVPMWMGGLPAGFCNEPAYGRQENGQDRYVEYYHGKRYPGYCSGLACYKHGGPKEARAALEPKP